MAVVITRIWRQEEDEKKMLASLYADEKTDLTDEMELADDYKLEGGSTAVTADGDVGIVDTEGAWHWLEE